MMSKQSPKEWANLARKNRRFFWAEGWYLYFQSVLLIVKRRITCIVLFPLHLLMLCLSLSVFWMNWENSGIKLPTLLQNNWQFRTCYSIKRVLVEHPPTLQKRRKLFQLDEKGKHRNSKYSRRKNKNFETAKTHLSQPQFKLAIFTLEVAHHSWLHQLIKVSASGSF